MGSLNVADFVADIEHLLGANAVAAENLAQVPGFAHQLWG